MKVYYSPIVVIETCSRISWFDMPVHAFGLRCLESVCPILTSLTTIDEQMLL